VLEPRHRYLLRKKQSSAASPPSWTRPVPRCSGTSRNVNTYNDFVVTFWYFVMDVVSTVTNFVTSSHITSDGVNPLKMMTKLRESSPNNEPIRHRCIISVLPMRNHWRIQMNATEQQHYRHKTTWKRITRSGPVAGPHGCPRQRHYVETSNRSHSICNGPLTPVTSTHICNDCCLAPVTYKRARTTPGLASTIPVTNVDFW
jgi:hypothetical protein